MMLLTVVNILIRSCLYFPVVSDAISLWFWVLFVLQLSSVESLCVSPHARDSKTAKNAIQLLHSQSHSDLTFEIILAHGKYTLHFENIISGTEFELQYNYVLVLLLHDTGPQVAQYHLSEIMHKS